MRHDIDILLRAPQVSSRITVSGHIYDVSTGLLTTITGPLQPHPGTATSTAAASSGLIGSPAVPLRE